jgi:hypothetical protein
MKTFKAICAATLLAVSLSLPAYADTAPGDQHTPGSPSPICSDAGTSTTTSGDIELADGATAVDDDISFSALADMLWTVASIF